MKPSLWAVEKAALDLVWPKAEPLLQKVVDRDPIYDLPHIKDGLNKGQYQLWLACSPQIEAAAVTQVKTDLRGKRCVIFMCGGVGVKRWLHHIKTIEEWAASLGCEVTSIEAVNGRRGWERLLPEYFVERRSVTYAKRLK